MAAPARVLVIDIGKTNAKLALVDTATLTEIETMTRPNRVLPGPPYPHADVDGVWSFILAGARALNARHGVDAIVPTTHGAAAALLDADGDLVLPILDYEHAGPETLSAAYDAVRPAFAETGSPRLPLGLNLGAQLYWQFSAFPEATAAATILPYPQFWAFRLCGVAACEPTSLGAHTDLWNPQARGFSALVEGQGWRRRMPPLRNAADRLGTVTPEVARATGLAAATPVFCGIHDSNASLLPHLRSRQAPFAVVSTGTWVISMAIGGRAVALDPARDTLINVNAAGDPVPSARFMGGREWETAMRSRPTDMAPRDAQAVLERGVMLLPAVEQTSGPFAGRAPRWTVPEETLAAGERAVVVSYYLGLMTAVGLEDIGADGPVLVEGPFARNPRYVEMLQAASGQPVVTPSAGGTGTSVGAALLVSPDLRPAPSHEGPAPVPAERDRAALASYAAAWRGRL